MFSGDASVTDLNARIVSELSTEKISEGSLPPPSLPLNRARVTSPQRDMSINSIETRVESPKSPRQRKVSQLTVRSQALSPGIKKSSLMSPRPTLFGQQIGSPTLSYSVNIQHKVDELNE